MNFLRTVKLRRECDSALWFLGLLFACFLSVAAASARPPRCTIEVVERGSGWPIPLVELRTTHQVGMVTDNAGRIAFDLPECFGRETWFEIRGHGYEARADGFGYRGVRLTPQDGKTLRIELDRTSIARRLGRLTGAGLFAESQKLNRELGWKESGVFGCDSVQTARHRGKLYWFWGDTVLPNYPLGIFDMSGATTELRPQRRWEPPLHFPYELFRDPHGRPRGVAPMPGSGPTWLSAITSLPDQNGTPRLVASFIKVKPPMEAYQSGLCVWSDTEAQFKPLRVLWTSSTNAPKAPTLPDGHAIPWQDETGRAWILFGNPFPNLRCPARFEAWQDPQQWEPLASPTGLRSASEDRGVTAHSGSIAWNEHRHRWVAVFMGFAENAKGFGAVWYAEAKTPFGPWGLAIRILQHDNYTFYNPQLDVDLCPSDSPFLLFEGTYSMQFADHAAPTPRYDYNQVLYRLDLDDPALKPAHLADP